jgi:hypothetical protein
LETPEVLRVRLDEIIGKDGKRLPQPTQTPEDCQPICAQFLRFSLGLGYGQNLKKIMEYIPGMKGKHVNTRDPKMRRNAKIWLHRLRAQHLCLPNADLTILPWNTRLQVHAAFWEEMEFMDPTATWSEEEPQDQKKIWLWRRN